MTGFKLVSLLVCRPIYSRSRKRRFTFSVLLAKGELLLWQVFDCKRDKNFRALFPWTVREVTMGRVPLRVLRLNAETFCGGCPRDAATPFFSFPLFEVDILNALS
jgi:hypothetical protein